MAPSMNKKRKMEEETEEVGSKNSKKTRKNDNSSVKTRVTAKGKETKKGNGGGGNGRRSRRAVVGGQDSVSGGGGGGRLRRMASLNAQAKMHALYDSDGRSSLEELVTNLEAVKNLKKPLPTTTTTTTTTTQKGKKSGGTKGETGGGLATSPRRMASLNAQAILAASYSTDRPKMSPKGNSLTVAVTPTAAAVAATAAAAAKYKRKSVSLEEEEDVAVLKRRPSLVEKKDRRVCVEKVRPSTVKSAAVRRLEEQMDLEKTLDLAKMVISTENELLLRDKVKNENVRQDNKIEDKAEVTITGMYINPVTNTSQSFCFSRVQTYKQATSTTFTQPPPPPANGNNSSAPRPPPAHHRPPPPPPPAAYCHFTHYSPNVPPSTPAGPAPVPLDLALVRHYTSAFAIPPHYAPTQTHCARPTPQGYYHPADPCLIHKPVPFHPFQSSNRLSQQQQQPPLANTPGPTAARASFSPHLASSYPNKSPRPLQTTALQRTSSPEIRRSNNSTSNTNNNNAKHTFYYSPRTPDANSASNLGCQLCIHFSSSASTSSASSSYCQSHWKSNNGRSLRGRPPANAAVLSSSGNNRVQPTKPDVGGRLSTLPTQTKTDVRTVSVFSPKKVKMEVDEIIMDLEQVPSLNKRLNNESPPAGNHPMATRRPKNSPPDVRAAANSSCSTRSGGKVVSDNSLPVRKAGGGGSAGNVTVSAEEFFKKVTASTSWMSSAQKQKHMEALRRAFNPTVAVPCLPLASQIKKFVNNSSRMAAAAANKTVVKLSCRDGEQVNERRRIYQHSILHNNNNNKVNVSGAQQQQQHSRSAASASAAASNAAASRKALTAADAGNGRAVVAYEAVQSIPRNRAIKNVTRYSNGWTWEGPAFQKDIYIKNDDPPVRRRCFPAMRHIEGDIIRIRDCVLLKSGPRKNDLPYVAKVAALWENPEDGEMMFSLLWYYRPEHTEFGRKPHHMEDEIFASKHRDVNSVACIEDKCYVLTMNEYCRYRRRGRMVEQAIVCQPSVVAGLSGGYQRKDRQPPGRVSPDMVFFCRKVYDFRQKRILKNPT